jgi:transcriptional regulator with XRE-family HTH domain
MKASRMLRSTRLRVGLTQRELADKAGLPQSTIGRIETGRTDPGVGTLTRLLRACGYDLAVEPRLGQGVDRTQIKSRLAMAPLERLERLTQEARALDVLRQARRPVTTRG